MRKCLLLFVLFMSVSGFSQSVNDYQYVIVPKRFNLFKEDDKYRLNTTTKLLLEKYGFKSYIDNDSISNEMVNNCQMLYADLEEQKALLAIKLRIVLKDCRGKVVYQTEFGKSREKDFAVGYNQALRDTSKSFDELNYKYNGKNDKMTTTPIPTDNPQALAGKAYSLDITPANQGNFYFAQPTATGFQVVDSEPKVILRLYATSQQNVFIGEKGAIKGVVISKNGQWFFEYYENGKLISESWNLKF